MKKYYNFLMDDIKTMSSKEIFWYWIFPCLLLLILLTFYFSSVPFLVELVAPESNREYGILENFQLIIILGIVFLSFCAVSKKHNMVQRIGFGILGVVAIFIFLEEMDYGDHFIRYFSEGKQRSIFLTTFDKNSIHNQDKMTLKYMRRTPYVIIFFLFTLAPFINKKYIHPLLAYLIPMPRMALMVVLFIVAYFAPRVLVDFNIFEVGNLGVGDSIGEFTELIVYYIFLIYVFHIIFDKEWNEFN